VKVPLSADIEHAYGGTPGAVADMVLRVIAAGAVGINIEDYVPGTADLEPIGLQADKVNAVVKAAAKAGVRVVVNARTDVFLRQSGEAARRVEMAVERGRAYRAAGADCVFIPGVIDAPTIRLLAAGIGAPINVLAVAGAPSVAELEALGVARVTVGSGPMRASIALVHDIARELKTHGTYASFTDHAMPYAELNDLMK
jgi:2-methylisocitrate lyase-like PEP mutase family enzyme